MVSWPLVIIKVCFYDLLKSNLCVFHISKSVSDCESHVRTFVMLIGECVCVNHDPLLDAPSLIHYHSLPVSRSSSALRKHEL